jgi:predicted ATPase
MKTLEDEAFEDIERRQGGFKAKQAMAADKLQEPEREALRQALDTLQFYSSVCNEDEQLTPAKTAIAKCKAALAQPAQEPVAWVGLTLDEIEELFQSAAGADEETDVRFARAIEQALKDKNT